MWYLNVLYPLHIHALFPYWVSTWETQNGTKLLKRILKLFYLLLFTTETTENNVGVCKRWVCHWCTHPHGAVTWLTNKWQSCQTVGSEECLQIFTELKLSLTNQLTDKKVNFSVRLQKMGSGEGRQTIPFAQVMILHNQRTLIHSSFITISSE